MKKQNKPRPLKLHPIEARILRDRWKTQGLDAQIHAMTGGNGEAIMSKAGSMFWVVLWASKRQGVDKDSPDLRMIRGAVNTLADMTSGHQITELQRGAVSAGLYAVDRLTPGLTPENLFTGGLVLQQLSQLRAITLADFPD